MTPFHRPRFQPHVEALEQRCTPSGSGLSISQFLAAQGSGDNFNFGVPGLPQEIGFGTSTASILGGNGTFGRIDYTGQDAAFLGRTSQLGTTTSGTVSTKPLKDGGQEITVNLHTHNAFAWAQHFNTDYSYGAVLFGYTPDVLAADSAHSLIPPLADCNLHEVYDVAPGAPVFWDLVDTFLGPNYAPPPGVTLETLDLRATAQGTTPSGQAATLNVSQTGLVGKGADFKDFGYTAEVVDVHTNNGGGGGAATSSAVAAATTTPPSAPGASPSSAIDSVFASVIDDPLHSGI